MIQAVRKICYSLYLYFAARIRTLLRTRVANFPSILPVSAKVAIFLVIPLTVEIRFVSLIHLELDEWIRGANPTFTELVDYLLLELVAIVLRVHTKLLRVDFLLKSNRSLTSAKQTRLNATEFRNKIQENE